MKNSFSSTDFLCTNMEVDESHLCYSVNVQAGCMGFCSILFRDCSSRRVIKRYHYAKVDPQRYHVRENEGSEDRLFRCSNCFVVVHEGCYPIGHVPPGSFCFAEGRSEMRE